MGMLNKFFNMSPHMRLALIISPLLAVGGFVLMDTYQESKAPSEQVYELVAEEECRLTVGPCKFSALGVTATLDARNTNDGGTVVTVKTSMAVKKVMLEAVGTSLLNPKGMRSINTKYWEQELPAALSSYDAFHVVFASRRAFLYLESDVR